MILFFCSGQVEDELDTITQDEFDKLEKKLMDDDIINKWTVLELAES